MILNETPQNGHNFKTKGLNKHKIEHDLGFNMRNKHAKFKFNR